MINNIINFMVQRNYFHIFVYFRGWKYIWSIQKKFNRLINNINKFNTEIKKINFVQ